MKNNKKLLIIGWDAADWTIINELMAKGMMPALKSVMQRGVSGYIATLDPPVSPMLWTTIATGKRPFEHGILGFIEPNEDNTDLRPVHSTSRKVKAFWNILNQQGYTMNIVGWWPSHPAEPINGCMVSNFYPFEASEKPDAPWPLINGTISNKQYTEILAGLRIHRAELTYAHILPFVHDMHKVDQKTDPRLGQIAKIITHNSSFHAATTWLMENTQWDVTAVYYDLIDHLSHVGMKFRPPRKDNINREMFEIYKHVVDGAYIFQDMMLERKLQLAGNDCAVMILSDHGFHSGAMRPKYIPNEPAGPINEHAPFGMFCFAGDGIKKNEKLYGASLLDVLPTLLHWLGLPVGKDMEGKVLLEAFSNPQPVNYIPSWEDNNEGYSAQHEENKRIDVIANYEAMAQLAELGYIEQAGEDVKKRIDASITETKFYLARSYADAAKWDEALQLLEDLCENIRPDIHRYRIAYIQTLINKKIFKKALQQLDKLIESGYKTEGFINYLYGRIYAAMHQPRKAIIYYLKGLDTFTKAPEIHFQLGLNYMLIRDYRAALNHFNESLKLQPENVMSIYGKGLVYYKTKQYEQAINTLLDAIELKKFFPAAHYQLGETLFETEYYEDAANAYETVCSQLPNNIKARKRLLEIYKHYLPDSKKYNEHLEVIENKIKQSIIVVSGLIGSNASLIVQLLKQFDYEVLHDNFQHPYFGEYSYSKVYQQEGKWDWIEQACGKVIKVEANYLFKLPDNFNYKLIYITRDKIELAKIQAELKNKTSKGISLENLILNEQQEQNLEEWVFNKPNMDLLFIDYKTLISNTEEELEKIESLLETTLDRSKMILHKLPINK